MRSGRNDRVLAACAGEPRQSERARADAAEPAATAQGVRRGEPLRGRRLRNLAGRRHRADIAVRDWLGGVDRGRGAEAAQRTWRFRARRLRAVFRAAVRRRCGDTPRRDRANKSQRRRRGRGAPGLGRDHRLGWRVCRDDRLRGERPLQGPLSPLRHYAREGGRGGVEQARQVS